MLTTQQQATLKAAIVADPILNAFPQTQDGAFAIAVELNKNASPEFYIWKESVAQQEIEQNGFNWVEVDNLTVGKARIWEWLFNNPSESINPSKLNVRDGITECWKGSAAKNAVRFEVFKHCQRLATKFEKLFATGAGTTTDQDGVGPASASLYGTVRYEDVYDARNS